ncbi:unnamed protein product [Adineta steineri]|uniref:Polyketide synthase-like phosphopantetheine-binding domain-containing protein n=2 Tax=Adineta steineri TaxID=433720 RepID=A0A815MPI6_9BILA|nr:unnamed protein product [Adineta steineri]
MSVKFRFSSIADMLQKHAQNRSDEKCLYYPNKSQSDSYASLTFKQFNEVTNHLAKRFSNIIRQKETNRNPVVCILANSDVDYLLTTYALFKLNVVVFPLSIRNSDAAIKHLLEKSNASYLFYSKAFSSVATTFDSIINLHQMEELNISELLDYKESSFKPEIDTDEIDRICIIFHSSGTTSFPKPIRLTTRYLFGWFESFASEMDDRFWSDDDLVLLLLPLFHVAGFGTTFIMFYVGGACGLPLGDIFPPTPKQIIKSIEYTKVTKVCTVPLFLQQLLRLLKEDENNGFKMLARLRFVLSVGAACSPDICKQLTEHGVKLIIGFGSTETGFILVSCYETNNKDQWQSLRKLKGRESNLSFLPLDSDNQIYELVVNSQDPFLAPEFKSKKFYSIGDLFKEEPVGSGNYTVQGRADDILVHMSGEKTNPLPIELAIQQCPIVEHGVVLGHQRLHCSVLIELNSKEASKLEHSQIEKQILTAVENANTNAPAHSHIAPALIKILPLDKHLPVTNKGNILRKQVYNEYHSEIEQIYEQFLNQSNFDSNIPHDNQQESWTKKKICDYLQETVAEILHKPIENFNDHSQSLYHLSLDSLTTVQLRNKLCQKFGFLDQNIIFEYPTIDALTDQLFAVVNNQQPRQSDDPQHYQQTEEIIDKYINLMATHTNKKRQVTNSDHLGKRIFLITGANGSLGSQTLLQLLNKPQVTKIYCLLRGPDAHNRLRTDMESRKQDTAVLDDKRRIIILSTNFDDDQLGQTTNIYQQLQREVTDIIHSAWKMDFNLTINDFDRECLKGLYQLLKLAATSLSEVPMHFHFISSVSAAGSVVIDKVKEEPLSRQKGIALPNGYGQSKYAAEHICWAAMNHWSVPVDIYRFGQISGDSETGVWNTREMISLMICVGCGEMGMLPEDGEQINWIPVNYGAACLVDIAINSSTRTTPPSERVHHIQNPYVITWSQLIKYLKSAGLHFKVVPTEEWIHQLLGNPKNPAYSLAAFFEKTFADGKICHIGQFSLEKTIRRTAILQNCPPIGQQLIQRYIKYWIEVGSLKATNS